MARGRAGPAAEEFEGEPEAPAEPSEVLEEPEAAMEPKRHSWGSGSKSSGMLLRNFFGA